MTAVDLYAATLVMVDPRTADTDQLPVIEFSSTPLNPPRVSRNVRRPRPRRFPPPDGRGRRALAAVLAVAMWVVAVPLAGRLTVEAGHASTGGRPVWAAALGALAGAAVGTLAIERWLTGRCRR